MITATLSKTAVNKAIEIAQNLNANAVIVEVNIGNIAQQIAVSEEAYINRDFHQKITRIATIDLTGAIS